MAVTGSFGNSMKSFMLNEWAGQTITVRALEGINVADQNTITFNASSGGGKLTRVANVSLSIPADTTINKIDVRVGTTTQFELPLGSEEVYFENGGNLIITQLDVEITDQL